jgi:hypothetical protein
MTYNINGLPSDLLTEVAEGERSLKVTENPIGQASEKDITYNDNGSINTITITDQNGKVMTSTYTWDALLNVINIKTTIN